MNYAELKTKRASLAIGGKNGSAFQKSVMLANRQAVLDVVLAATMKDGVSISAVCEATGLCLTTVGNSLRMHMAAGLIDRRGKSGQAVRWGPPGISATYKQSKKALGCMTAHARRKLAAAEADAFARQSIKRTVKATEATPLRPAGPVSVFRMAEAG